METEQVAYPERIQHIILYGHRISPQIPKGEELTGRTKTYCGEGTLVSRRISPTTVRVALSVVHPSDTFSKKEGVRVAREAFENGQTIDLSIPDTVGIHQLNRVINLLLSYTQKDVKVSQFCGTELRIIPNLPGRFVQLEIEQRY